MTEQTSDIEGTPIEEAIEHFTSQGQDRAAIEQALRHVAMDGVISEEGLEQGLSQASMSLSHLEQQVAMLADRFAHARSMANRDLETVRHRIDRFDERLDTIESTLSDIIEDVRSMQEADHPESLLEQGQRLEELRSAAGTVNQRADECAADLEDLERWLQDPGYRFEQLAEDASALAQTVEDLDRQVAAIDEQDIDEPGQAWLDAKIRERVASVLLADVRFELRELEEWSAPAEHIEESEVGDPERIEEAVDGATDALDRLRGRLETVARPAWAQEYDDTLTDLEEALEPLEPPMDWAKVERVVEDHRSNIQALQADTE